MQTSQSGRVLRTQRNVTKQRYRNTIFVLILNLIFTLLVIRGQYYTEAFGIKRALFLFVLSFVFVFVLPFFVYRLKFLNEYTGRIIDLIIAKCKWAVSNPGKLLLGAVLYFGAFVLTWITIDIYSKTQNRSFITPLFHLIVTVLFLLLTVFLMRNQLGTKPEKLFLILLIITGTYFINSSPINTGVAWDDETHYRKILTMANFPSGIWYQADKEVLDKQVDTVTTKFGFSEKDRESHEALVNQLYEEKVSSPFSSMDMGQFSAVAYIPFAFGITLGRGLNLTYSMIFRLGKLCNLYTYGVVVYYAMKRLRFGKILVACIAILPTMVFMASTYSYDPCLVAFTLLGFSIFFSYLQNPTYKMKNSDIVLICVSFLIGCLPKAVYCISMLPLLFMPSSRFVSKKQHRMYIVCGCLTVGFLLSTFLIPRLFVGFGKGDFRGGSGVDATKQLQFIINNPGAYFHILGNFLIGTYFLPSNAINYTEIYAWLGTNYFNYGTPILLYIIGLLDRDGTKGKTRLVSISTLIGVLLCIIAVASAIYLEYNPVGHFTINGCQFRYLLPLLFPFIYILGFDKLKNTLPAKLFNAFPMLWMCISFVVYTGTVMTGLY